MEDAARLELHRIGYAPDGGRHAPPGNAGEAPPLHTALIAALLDDVEAIPTPDFFAAQMLRKTPREVEAIRRANRAAAAGLRAFFDALHPGLSETEVAGRVEAAIQACTGQDGIGLARGWAYVQAGDNALLAGPISRSSGYALRDGDLVLLELGTFTDGYWSDLTRVSVVGHPTQIQADLLATVRAAQRAALAAVRPGATHASVDAAARRVIETRGMGPGFTHATGHHVGFRWHDPGPMLAAGSEEPLEAGMVVTIEPGVYGPQFGGGARFEDNVLVTEHGAEILSPYDLIA
jgi:Xaa-Pro aminopeptidase